MSEDKDKIEIKDTKVIVTGGLGWAARAVRESVGLCWINWKEELWNK